ncbi:uncharacterized protein AMSG_00047 [Thecamonas trahens ATCC 50062]|uniref:J domain-containing protein n=1 Tax=Thecamonas trahens ATCC 50062 TaxID=461836 RepID=A0A0L0D3Q4_THETB|nr:hypothetical protein AMSG_00047 [Thecamonas trahens ATCC 50062]KNC45933.1 hypothetical protein AMSG_00047 [Thecamonas trahens ATCC 50062]|eukprot:XP_013762916.1 hypothetical protein AMSG_00047 [Thecamonas trahens ATCC 50062]
MAAAAAAADETDYYQLLGVSRSATPKAVDAGYEAAHAQIMAGEVGTRSRKDALLAINQAYAVLADAEARAEYDAARADALADEADASRRAQVLKEAKEVEMKRQERRRVPGTEKVRYSRNEPPAFNMDPNCIHCMSNEHGVEVIHSATGVDKFLATFDTFLCSFLCPIPISPELSLTLFIIGSVVFFVGTLFLCGKLFGCKEPPTSETDSAHGDDHAHSE